jgi:protein-tyrosine-phosphatase/DNA-binding HxlR family transcriptional regulator
MSIEVELSARARVHRALGEPGRLAVVDALLVGDASPSELGGALGMSSNLLAHHLGILEDAGVIIRVRSEGDRRRSYVRLAPAAFAALVPAVAVPATRVVFVCTHNSARSQLAAALWSQRSRVPAASAGTHPRPRVHRRAVATAGRHGLILAPSQTAHIRDVLRAADLVVVVCDNAHEELGRIGCRLHWSVPDPARADTDEAFERAYDDIADRVGRLAAAVDQANDDGRSP